MNKTSCFFLFIAWHQVQNKFFQFCHPQCTPYELTETTEADYVNCIKICIIKKTHDFMKNEETLDRLNFIMDDEFSERKPGLVAHKIKTHNAIKAQLSRKGH